MNDLELADRLRARADADTPEIAAAIDLVETRLAVRHSMLLEDQEPPTLPREVAAIMRVAHLLGTAGWQPAAILTWWQAPHSTLDGRVPSAVLDAGDADAVVAAAAHDATEGAR